MDYNEKRLYPCFTDNVNTMDSKGNWRYITLDSVDEKPDDYDDTDYNDDGSVVSVYHYDVYDRNDLIPVESFESRNMNTIIREVFAQSALDAMQADGIGIGLHLQDDWF